MAFKHATWHFPEICLPTFKTTQVAKKDGHVCRLQKTDKETHKQVYYQLLSRCCKELTASQIKLLPPNMRTVIEPKFEAHQEKKRM